jgi:hypothetical protein
MNEEDSEYKGEQVRYSFWNFLNEYKATYFQGSIPPTSSNFIFSFKRNIETKIFNS